MEDQLVAFVRSKKQVPPPDTDWQAKRDRWIRAVDGLYDQVRKLLRDLIDSGDIVVRSFDIPVAEDPVEPYRIEALELTIGAERVELRPKGFSIVGASGRVDLRGDRDTVTLVQDSSGWVVILQRVPRLEAEPLSRDTLKWALERVMLP